jgi:hypothetical protein
MMRSPYDGLSRRPLRVGLAVVGAATVAFETSAFRAGRRGFGVARSSPAFLLWIGERPAVVAILALAGVAALFLFARRPAAILPGSIALLVMASLSESHTALSGGVSHFPFVGGAALLGWLLGLAYARGLRPRRAGAFDEALAEAGAVAMVAATYVCSGLAKLVKSGPAWADDTTLRATVLSLHRVDDTSVLGAYARLVVAHPGASRALAAASLIIETCAFLYVAHPRLRVLWGALLLGFHLNVLLLLGIPYVLAAATVLLFSFPWPRLAGPPAAAPELSVDPVAHRDVAVLTASLIALGVSVALLLPGRS